MAHSSDRRQKDKLSGKAEYDEAGSIILGKFRWPLCVKDPGQRAQHNSKKKTEGQHVL